MDSKQRKDIEHRFIEELQKTKALVAEYQELSKPIAPENAIGRISRMDAINNKSVTEAALLKAEEKLRMLEYGLTQLDKKGFGTCARCQQPIPLGRLLLMPQSIHCVHCAR